MKELELGKHQRARIWVGELPDASYAPIRTVTYDFPAESAGETALRLAAVELLVPTGGRYMYGLLGGRWEPAAMDHLTVVVSVSAENGRSFTDSLARRVDEVHVGLPSEYADAPRAGVELVKEEDTPLPSGRLYIDHAAHGLIGSCVVVYEHLAAILVKLFNIRQSEPSDEQLVGLFPADFSYRGPTMRPLSPPIMPEN